MLTRDATLTDVELLEAQTAEAEVAFEMDEDTFRSFYDRTARPLWAYLSRMTGDPHTADDLLQEAYYRFLRTKIDWESDTHRRAYLFRIGTNLVRDGHRRNSLRRTVDFEAGAAETLPAQGIDPAAHATRRTDLQRAMAKLRPRDRALLWLAYAQGQPHAEIAAALGLKTSSIKLLLFRARKRLAALLRNREPNPGGLR